MSYYTGALQKADMEVPRTPQELRDWVERKIASFGCAEGRSYARSGDRLYKKFMEEIRPFSFFAWHQYGSESSVLCTPNLTNDNYDGRIDFSNPVIDPVYVEITYAKDGYDESLRMEVLSAQGSVNALGKISFQGTRASGRSLPVVANVAVRHDDIVAAAQNLIRERITGKGGKQYGQDHVLVVVVEDYIAFQTDDEWRELAEYTESILVDIEPDFGAVFLLGSSGKRLSHVWVN